MQLSVYKQFSENLIALCAKHGSIADVCRKTGINRQQFSRYLTGTSLPNEETLNKIASFFELQQAELFRADLFAGKNRSDIRKVMGSVSELPPELKDAVSSLVERSANVSLPPAAYAVYAPWAQADGRIVRGTLVVSSKKGAALFTMDLPVDEASGGNILQGTVEGFIVQDKSRLSMIGHWTEWQHATCIVNINAENSANQKTWHGTLSTFLPTGVPVVSKAIIDHFGPQQKQAECAQANGIMATDDARVPDHLRSTVAELGRNQATLIATDALRNWR